MHDFQCSGQIIDIEKEKIYPGTVSVSSGKIAEVISDPSVEEQHFILPGFVDAHVHVESSMLIPSEFARLAVVHGTVATVSDPHEIGNVLGVEGVRFMIRNGKEVNFKFYFGAPSCVPATDFETAGAVITADDIRELFEKDQIKYLAEMMNWPGVLYNDPVVYDKLEVAKNLNKPIDGHAPGLKGEQALQYINAGISTDHECFTQEEALDKLEGGMKVIIREGSAAKNFEALIDLMHEHYGMMMFCSDDKHPDNLVEGHINHLARRAVEKGVDLFKVLKAACVNPVKHYGLEVGLLNPGDPADFIILEDLKNCLVKATYINGELVAKDGTTQISSVECDEVNNFAPVEVMADDLQVKATGKKINLIEAYDGQLVTGKINSDALIRDDMVVSDIDQDYLKMVVVNRYSKDDPAVAFIKNFNLKSGAIASSVAHDSHNVIAVGVDDQSIAEAINLVMQEAGGVSAVSGSQKRVLPLPIAGLMSAKDGYWVAEQYSQIDRMAKEMGSTLTSPFMTLSFMALLVIPSLKLSDKGLFDGDKFEFIPLFSE